MNCNKCKKEMVDLKCTCGKILVRRGIHYTIKNKKVVCKHCNKQHELELVKALIRTGASKVL